MTEDEMSDMYQLMAIANYEDRFVIPTNHREYAGDGPFDQEIAFSARSECGFSFGSDSNTGSKKKTNLFGTQTHNNTLSGTPRKVPGGQS
jgi:nitrate reductase beta subunit